jgi:[acyl-carrier-protein] S-malonyltransferase
MDAYALAERLPNCAFAFRGYNVENLGRSRELLEHPVYGPFVAEELAAGAAVCQDIVGRPIDLIDRVLTGREASLEEYDEAIALVVAVERAQLRILREVFDIDLSLARLAMGYSLGEIAALIACGVFAMQDAIRVPISLAKDCVSLAHDTILGVLFSRGNALPVGNVHRLCTEINQEGRGVIGVSSYLSPNSLLLMGQGDTVKRFRARMRDAINNNASLRLNHHRWPPMHTPITWQCSIPDRAAQMMLRMPGGLVPPHPPVLSLVTGQISYNDYNARELLHRWVDYPQRLWDAVYYILSVGIDTVVHVGPTPNIVPATFHRLSENVQMQTKGSLGLSVLSEMARRPWLKSLLPQRTALLRAPSVVHIVLEDWLLAHAPPAATALKNPGMPGGSRSSSVQDSCDSVDR